MEWEIIVALVVMIPVIILPFLVVWCLKVSDALIGFLSARGKRGEVAVKD